MTALIVIGAIALFIFILLASSLTVDMEYDQVFKYRVKYLFFTFVKNPLSPREIKKKQKKEQRKKKKQEKEQGKKGAHLKQNSESKPQKSEAEEPKTTQPAKQTAEKKQEQDKPAENADNAQEKPKMKFSLDLIKRIIGRASPHVKRIFRKIRFYNVVIDITTGGDDAAKTAISYGVHCSAVYGLVAFLNSVICFKADRISVRADFALEKSEYYAKATVKLRLSTLLHSGIWGFFAVLSELRKDSVAGENTSPEEKKAA